MAMMSRALPTLEFRKYRGADNRFSDERAAELLFRCYVRNKVVLLLVESHTNDLALYALVLDVEIHNETLTL